MWREEMPSEEYLVDGLEVEGRVVLMTQGVFDQLMDYSRSLPTGPSPGRVYKKNYGWPDDMPDNWFFFYCDTDPDDSAYVVHHPYQIVVV